MAVPPRLIRPAAQISAGRIAGPSRLPMPPDYSQPARLLLRPLSHSAIVQNRLRTASASERHVRFSHPIITGSYPPVRLRRFASTIVKPSASSHSHSHSSSSAPPPDPSPEPEPTSAYGRFKQLSKKYGKYAIAVYFALSAVDLSITFGIVHAFGAERIEPAFKAIIHQYRKIRYGEEEAIKIEQDHQRETEAKRMEEEAELAKLSPEERKKKQASTWGSRTFWAELVLAYTIHKTLLLPVRAGFTVAWTPPLVKWLTARGWVGKGGLVRAAEHARGRVQTASSKVRERASRTKQRTDRKRD
ncbi:hypothetical protein BD324DRAFT_612506 [Kockovaella imperatae]|uniref:DUF1279 domain-containing protein n=1 Tax=Kockovaella imperatae TaxID=4999 RepID=A0A1Y1USA3_9TREE|nr:hypothetical protein BD324DRAFT_612506 [Kockovaella imperatae]ORX40900.1 hypothetical protein BD324DRAFT_612506 [Kockovaella imperatae]